MNNDMTLRALQNRTHTVANLCNFFVNWGKHRRHRSGCSASLKCLSQNQRKNQILSVEPVVRTPIISLETSRCVLSFYPEWRQIHTV